VGEVWEKAAELKSRRKIARPEVRMAAAAPIIADRALVFDLVPSRRLPDECDSQRKRMELWTLRLLNTRIANPARCF